MLGYNNINFKYKRLYKDEENTGFSVVPSSTKGMWKVRWQDGVLSEDHYNLGWVKQNCKKVYLKTQNSGEGVPF